MRSISMTLQVLLVAGIAKKEVSPVKLSACHGSASCEIFTWQPSQNAGCESKECGFLKALGKSRDMGTETEQELP